MSGKPAARQGDMTQYGGSIVQGSAAKVLLAPKRQRLDARYVLPTHLTLQTGGMLKALLRVRGP